MATMNISLPSGLASFVENEVASGEYSTQSEVFREALRLLQHDKELEKEKLAILRREINIGIEDAENGRFSNQSVREIADEVREEYLG